MARKIDACGIWCGNQSALDEFAQVWAIDCGACDDTFRRIYGWNADCLEDAKQRAFPGYGVEESPLLWSDQA